VPNPVFIIWKDDYSVGHVKIDDHHKHVIAIINNFYVAIQEGLVQKELNKILEKLFKYTQFHFKLEERLMEKHQFPDFLKHKNIHDRMVQKTGALRRQNFHREDTTTSETMSFLKEWWLNHICIMDMQYKSYLPQKKA